MLSRLVPNRSHCSPSRAFNASTKRHLQISRSRRALLAFSVAAAPSRKRTPAPRRSLRVVAAVVLEWIAYAGLGALIISAGEIAKAIQNLFAVQNQLAQNVQYALSLAAFVAFSITLAYMTISLIDWGWSLYQSKEKETRLQQLRKELMSDFCKRLSLPTSDQNKQLDLLASEWTVDLLYSSCLKNTFVGFSADLKESGLKQTTILAVWDQLHEKLQSV